MNKYKNLLITTAISLAAVTSIVAVSANSKGNILNVVADEPVNNSSRTITITSANRWVNLKAGNNSEWSTVAYRMDDELAHGLIKTSQSQEDIYNKGQNAVFALWDISRRTFNFDINPTDWDGKTVEIYGSGDPFTVVKYRHLTQIDFVLDKGKADGSDRTFDFKVSTGVFNLVEEPEGQNTKIYRWTPNNAEGFISYETISFSLNERKYDNKGIWVKGITFYYDC